MKLHLLAGTSVLALLAATAGADATPFNYTGTVVEWQVPTSGEYNISAYGAEGSGGEAAVEKPGQGAKPGVEVQDTAGGRPGDDGCRVRRYPLRPPPQATLVPHVLR